MARTITVYHQDGTKTEFSGDKAGKAISKDSVYDITDHTPFHLRMIKSYQMAEANGQLQGMSDKAKSFVRDVHETAHACGGDLPPEGSTRLGY